MSNETLGRGSGGDMGVTTGATSGIGTGEPIGSLLSDTSAAYKYSLSTLMR